MHKRPISKLISDPSLYVQADISKSPTAPDHEGLLSHGEFVISQHLLFVCLFLAHGKLMSSEIGSSARVLLLSERPGSTCMLPLGALFWNRALLSGECNLWLRGRKTLPLGELHLISLILLDSSPVCHPLCTVHMMGEKRSLYLKIKNSLIMLTVIECKSFV